MYIAIFKWLDTLAPTIQLYGQTGSRWRRPNTLMRPGSVITNQKRYIGIISIDRRQSIPKMAFMNCQFPSAYFFQSV
jgi:hypothetical protein